MKIAIPEFDRQINYYKALEMLGAEAVQVGAEADPADFDGLLIPGGADIDPARYGCENLGSLGIDKELDELQFSVLDRFVKAGKPVFGICRGHQLIAAYFGLPLVQDIQPPFMHVGASHEELFHKVTAVPGSLLCRLYGSEFTVNSTHHQAVAKDGKTLKSMAEADSGINEALFHTSLPVLSVQWHPERLCFDFAREDAADGSLLFREFLKLCRA